MLRIILFLSAALLIASAAAKDDKVDLTITVNAQSVHLSCDGAKASKPGGQQKREHPRPKAACLQLSSVEGRLGNMWQGVGPCTTEYNPQNVKVFGSYKGRTVQYQRTYGNPCAVNQVGNGIFRIGTLDNPDA